MPFDSQPTLGGELLSARPLQATEHSALYAVASDASPNINCKRGPIECQSVDSLPGMVLYETRLEGTYSSSPSLG